MKVTNQDYYMDGYLHSNLEKARTLVKKDWDMVFVIDGEEGVGKSVLTQQMAYFLDPTLTVQTINFNPDKFEECIRNAKKFQSIILDEAYGALSSRGSMSGINRSIVKMLSVIREKNLFIFIVLPTFFELDKYVAIWRSRALIRVYAENFKRGTFSFYNKDLKQKLYILGKKTYNYQLVTPNFRGSFTNHYTVDEEEYRKKKTEDSLKADNSKRTLAISITKKLKAEIAKNLKETDLTQKKISEILGVTTMTIHRYLKQIEQNS